MRFYVFSTARGFDRTKASPIQSRTELILFYSSFYGRIGVSAAFPISLRPTLSAAVIDRG